MTNFLTFGFLLFKKRVWIYPVLLCLISFEADAQGNGKPKITGQAELITNEEQSIIIQMTHLIVEDRDDWFYPWGFTMKVYPGTNYTLNGFIVTPSVNFSGKIIVPVTVNDGDQDSNPFDLTITVAPVNDKPVITAHTTTLTTNESQPITISLDHFTVTDPDNSYPTGFSLRLLAGANYTIDRNNVIPQSGFSGSLSVSVVVNDGGVDSDPYSFAIEVKPINRVPEIVSQAALQVNEDASLTILSSHLTVVDLDSNYPEGFSFILSPGENYAISNTTITPTANFFGNLTVPISVNDGKNTSKPFNLSITVTPVNDVPEITQVETEPAFYGFGNTTTQVSKTISVSDVDGDSIMYAEVGIRPNEFNTNFDKLSYTPEGNAKLRGVFDINTGILTIYGQASPATYAKALRFVYFNTLADQPSGNKILYFLVNDGKSNSKAIERSLVYGEPTVSLEIPSGFTPNGDMANDTWKIIPAKNSDEYLNARIRVYNKAGRVVYESVGFQNEWDGRLNGELLPADTYFYTIDLNLLTPQGYVKGVVTILR